MKSDADLATSVGRIFPKEWQWSNFAEAWKLLDFRKCFINQVEVTGLLKTGENEITIEVATTPAREQLALPQPPFDFGYEATEATGMFGKIGLSRRTFPHDITDFTHLSTPPSFLPVQDPL